MKKRTWIIVLAVVMVIVTGVWLWWGNSALQMHHINIANKKDTHFFSRVSYCTFI